MRTPGLIRCGSTIQPARWPGTLGTAPAASSFAAGDVREVRARPRPRAAVPCTAWHIRHDALQKHRLPAGLHRVGRLRGGLPLRFKPCVELLGRLGDDRQAHLRVLVAAELGALAPVDARAGRPAARSSSGGRGPCPSSRAGSAPRSCGSRRPSRARISTATGWLGVHGDVDLVGGGDAVGRACARRIDPASRRTAPPTTTGARSALMRNGSGLQRQIVDRAARWRSRRTAGRTA